MKIQSAYIGIILSLFMMSACAQKKEAQQNTLPIHLDSTLPWSQRMAETVLVKYPDLWSIEEGTEPKWTYTYGLVGLSCVKLYEETGNKKYYNYTKKYLDALIDQNGIIKTYKKSDYNIDKINSGKLLFYYYNKTHDKRYKTAMDTLRQQLRKHPRTQSGCFWHKQRYPYQMWLDGVYMGAPFYARYGKEYNEPENFDDVAHWIISMEKVARDPATGLLYHAWDESRVQQWADPETGLSPHFWGRAMGWYAMALVDVLDYFPENHPKRDSIINIVNRLAKAIIKIQHPQKGIWYQVLDQGNREGNYLEGSVSSMFAYFLFKSVKMGYIDKAYLQNAIKAYQGIVDNLITVNKDGTITISPVCAVAGLGGDPYRDGSYDYYIHEMKRDNDPKAVGPFIMASLLYEQMVE